MKTTFHYTVTQSDIDELNHMNFNRYVLIFSDARLNWLDEIGLGLPSLIEKSLGTALIKFDTTYHREVRLGETVRLETELSHVGNKSFAFQQKMYREDELCSECNAILVIMDLEKRQAIPVPKEIAQHYKITG